jgi:hypothetical protein
VLPSRHRNIFSAAAFNACSDDHGRVDAHGQSRRYAAIDNDIERTEAAANERNAVDINVCASNGEFVNCCKIDAGIATNGNASGLRNEPVPDAATRVCNNSEDRV